MCRWCVIFSSLDSQLCCILNKNLYSCRRLGRKQSLQFPIGQLLGAPAPDRAAFNLQEHACSTAFMQVVVSVLSAAETFQQDLLIYGTGWGLFRWLHDSFISSAEIVLT